MEYALTMTRNQSVTACCGLNTQRTSSSSFVLRFISGEIFFGCGQCIIKLERLGAFNTTSHSMQTLRVHAQGSEAEHAWIDLMPVERFAREHDTIPELSLCFARISS